VPWKCISISIEGTSHQTNEIPCQDCSVTNIIATPYGSYLVAVASDGCGTSRFSQLGSDLITQNIYECIEYWLRVASHKPDLLDIISFSLGQAHQALKKKSVDLSIDINDLAATCLCLVVGQDSMAASQIGDGIIAGELNGVLGCLFWPNQEYSNITDSLTDRNWYDKVQSMSARRKVDSLDSWFLATDGIQSIACDYRQRIPHVAFVSSLMKRFRDSPIGTENLIRDRLIDFLRSEKVTTVVTDDKTIILACA